MKKNFFFLYRSHIYSIFHPFVCILFVFIASIYTSCISIKNVEVGKVSDIQLGAINEKDVTLYLQVPVKNPNNFKIKITKAHLEISLNKTMVGRIKEISKIVIPKNSNTDQNITVKLQFGEIDSNNIFQTFIKNRNSLELNGYIKARAFMIGKKFQIKNQKLMKLYNGRI